MVRSTILSYRGNAAWKYRALNKNIRHIRKRLLSVKDIFDELPTVPQWIQNYIWSTYNNINFFRGYVLIVFLQREQNFTLHSSLISQLHDNFGYGNRYNFKYKSGYGRLENRKIGRHAYISYRNSLLKRSFSTLRLFSTQHAQLSDRAVNGVLSILVI